MNFVASRNKFIGFLYRNILKNFLFLFDPERIHNLFLLKGRFLGSNPVTRAATSLFFNYSNPSLKQTILGIKFKNPVGLAAGFDKNAILTKIIPEVGFGFMEIGSITAKPYAGNKEPRLARLPKSQSLVVNYGLKNQGALKISERLKNRKFKIPVGISIAKTNSKETVDVDNGIKDYIEGYRNFLDIGDYFTINISCPNSFGGEPFTDPKKLEGLLIETDKIRNEKPIFVKFSPDLLNNEIDNLLSVIQNHKIDGIISSNLTKKRLPEKMKDNYIPERGGLSGKAVEDLTNNQIRYIYQKTRRKYIIIGCGGVFSAEDAYKKIKAGASLIQLITGMIFEGPQVISEINLGLVKLLEKDGFKNISEAIGKDNR